MNEERKKVEKKPVIQVEPKKRVEPIPELKVVETAKIDIKTKPKNKRSENKYIRLALGANMEDRKAFSERIQKGELKLAFYAVDGDVGYHYYLVLR